MSETNSKENMLTEFDPGYSSPERQESPHLDNEGACLCF